MADDSSANVGLSSGLQEGQPHHSSQMFACYTHTVGTTLITSKTSICT